MDVLGWSSRAATVRAAIADERRLAMIGADENTIAGSIQVQCERCVRRVYLSPESQGMLERRKHPTEVICLGCAAAIHQAQNPRSPGL